MADQRGTTLVRFAFFIILSLKAREAAGSFRISNNQFLLDGEPLQLISGSMHYFRIPPAYWQDRLLRLRAMGLNSIEFYVPWNFHEPYPEEYCFGGEADLEKFLELAHDVGLLVLLRPGPYICAEWDFGGLPWWLASSKVQGGRTMVLRSDDADYLTYVERWWKVLFERVQPYLYSNGGPIIMVQVENEYGFCGSVRPAEGRVKYLRELVRIAREGLGDDVILYTTDPPNVAAAGTLPGSEVFTTVDFGAGWYQLDDAFGIQKSFNPPGMSPPICTEYYTGWLTHWSERMANTTAEGLVWWFKQLLQYANNTGSVSFYMAHGGTNFGFWAGANLDGSQYQPHITSYDYDAPISEAGAYGQPGIGGVNKHNLIREAVLSHTGGPLPDIPPPPKILPYGTVYLTPTTTLMHALSAVSRQPNGIQTEKPDIMEEYGQRWGLVLYRTLLPAAMAQLGGVLHFEAHDYAQVFLNGVLVGISDRSSKQPVSMPPWTDVGSGDEDATVDILVQAMGRVNFGCNWDFKGIVSPNVTYNGSSLTGWTVFSLDFEDVQHKINKLPMDSLMAGDGHVSGPLTRGPTFFRGTFSIPEGTLERGSNEGHLPDTFLAVQGWSKGIAWVNGFNLGWYWPEVGPQMSLYIPGTLLKEGDNTITMLEINEAPQTSTVELVSSPNFYGPRGAVLREPKARRDAYITKLSSSSSNNLRMDHLKNGILPST